MGDRPHTKIDDDGRVCTKCCTYKIWNDFEVLKQGIHGRRSSCRECNRGRQRSSTDTYAQKTKREVMTMYGGACACCEESHLAFLTIDHINNDGASERRAIESRGGHGFYRSLLKLDRRDDLQVLCWNCNLAKRTNRGVCPHEEET